MLIYLDESGDLGWKFDAPYRQGGSSRYLTLAALCVSSQHEAKPKRLIRTLYDEFGWKTTKEKKWADMKPDAKARFVELANALSHDQGDSIQYYSITVKKEKVQDHIRTEPNKLYNYMLGLSLLKTMSKHQQVDLFPDARSIKVQSGNSLHDYLQTKLWFDKGASTILRTIPTNSAKNQNVQFADMLTGVVQSHHEDGNSEHWKALNSQITGKALFF